MKSPQLENGFTRIANEIFDALARTKMNGTQRNVIDVIFRKTYGFQKKFDYIPLSQFQNMTGITRAKICQAIKDLEIRKIILVDRNEVMTGYRFNKNYDDWTGVRVRTSTHLGSIQKDTTIPTQLVPKTVETSTHLGTSASTHLGTLKRKTKEIQKKVPKGTGAKAPNPDISFLIDYLKKTMELRRLDGSEKINRRYCYLLLKSYKREEIHDMISACLLEDFHVGNATSMKYIYNSASKLFKLSRYVDRPSVVKI